MSTVVQEAAHTIANAKGGAMLINRFGDLNRVIYYHGSSKKLESLEQLERSKPHWSILMPDSKFLGKLYDPLTHPFIAFWNIIMMSFLLYSLSH